MLDGSREALLAEGRGGGGGVGLEEDDEEDDDDLPLIRKTRSEWPSPTPSRVLPATKRVPPCNRTTGRNATHPCCPKN